MTSVGHWLDMLRHSGESRNPDLLPGLFEKMQKILDKIVSAA